MYITPLVTARIKATLKELSIGNAIDLANMPAANNEAGIYATAKLIVSEANLPIEQWTIQECYAAVLHYHFYAINKGRAFVVDEETQATVTDYLYKDRDYPIQRNGRKSEALPLVYEFELDSDSEQPDRLKMIPLTGAWIEAVERCVLAGRVKQITNKREAWRVACAAAQIHARDFDESWLTNGGISIDAYISENINRILAMPIGDYDALMAAFDAGVIALDHIVCLRPFDDGFALMPVVDEKGGTALMPYRFCFDAVIPYGTLEVWAGIEESGSDHAD